MNKIAGVALAAVVGVCALGGGAEAYTTSDFVISLKTQQGSTASYSYGYGRTSVVGGLFSGRSSGTLTIQSVSDPNDARFGQTFIDLIYEGYAQQNASSIYIDYYYQHSLVETRLYVNQDVNLGNTYNFNGDQISTLVSSLEIDYGGVGLDSYAYYGGDETPIANLTLTVAPVPLPATASLFGSALIALGCATLMRSRADKVQAS